MRVLHISLVVIVFLLLATSAVVQAQSLRLYDDFNGSWLDPTKWATTPTCSTTAFLDTARPINVLDCSRTIAASNLRLMVRAYGRSDSDWDQQFGPSELYFANPNAVRTINTTFTIKKSKSVGCPTNDADAVGQVMIGGTFFNAGIGDPSDDVNAVLFVNDSGLYLPKGNRHAGAYVFSSNAWYGWIDLGNPKGPGPFTATIAWDQPNQRFQFILASPSEVKSGDVFYWGTDSLTPAAPMKLLAARTFVANCTTNRTQADMTASFYNVFTNE